MGLPGNARKGALLGLSHHPGTLMADCQPPELEAITFRGSSHAVYAPGLRQPNGLTQVTFSGKIIDQQMLVTVVVPPLLVILLSMASVTYSLLNGNSQK